MGGVLVQSDGHCEVQAGRGEGVGIKKKHKNMSFGVEGWLSVKAVRMTINQAAISTLYI